MVWEYQVPTIVMLTRCVESARVSLTPTIYSLPSVNVFLLNKHSYAHFTASVMKFK